MCSMVSILLPDSAELILSRIMMLIYCKLSQCLKISEATHVHCISENMKCHLVFDDQIHVIICLSTGPEVQYHSLDLRQGPGTGFQSYSCHPSSVVLLCHQLLLFSNLKSMACFF